MKKLIILSFVLIMTIMLGSTKASAEVEKTTEEQAKDQSSWTLTRTSFELTEEGIVLSQTEMGTPDNHAISILEVPFEDNGSFEITFKVSMDEYIASGRNSNDVWAGVGVMGAPKFINWRNSETYGLAKDSPGLFTRFFNYGGDLRYESSVYQGEYYVSGKDDPSSDVVDTWQLVSGNASASASSEITFKMAYDGVAKNGGTYYNCYINGECISSLGEMAHIEREKIFAEGKIYLLIVMNTQEDDFNTLSKFTVTKINGVPVKLSTGQGENTGSKTTVEQQQNNPTSSTVTTTEKKGCGSVIALSSCITALSTSLIILVLKKKDEENR